jgi:hypothetical protein
MTLKEMIEVYRTFLNDYRAMKIDTNLSDMDVPITLRRQFLDMELSFLDCRLDRVQRMVNYLKSFGGEK